MHEVDMTRCLLQVLEGWRHQHPVQPHVGTIHLLVGEFTCVEPSQLQLSFAAAVRDTWLAGARLSIASVPLVGGVPGVRQQLSAGSGPRLCLPLLWSPPGNLLSGRELKIQRIDYSRPLICGPPVQATPCGQPTPSFADPSPCTCPSATP